MTTINPYSELNGASGAQPSRPRDQLGQDDFLKLIVEQLKNQDPFKPMDPSQFLSQLTQFSTVTGIQDMQGALGQLGESLRASRALDGATLVGRDVLAASSSAELSSGGTVQGAVEIPDGATSVRIGVRDAAGQLVREFPVDPAAGFREFTWDGRDDSGQALPAGTYEIEVIASGGGDSASLQPLVVSRISSVTIDSRGNRLLLNTDNGTLTLNDVYRVM